MFDLEVFCTDFAILMRFAPKQEKWLQQKCLWCTDIMKKAERPQRMEYPSGDVCRTVVTFSQKVLKIRVVRTGRSRQAGVRGGYDSTTLRAMQK